MQFQTKPMSRRKRLRVVLLAAWLGAALGPAAVAQSQPAETAPVPAQLSPDSAKLKAFFAAEWERALQDSPETASYMGDPRFDDRWTDFSPAAIAARQAADLRALDALHAISRAGLSPADKLDYDTFEWQLQRNIERQKFREYLQPIGHQGGVQTADGIAEVMPFASVADYQKWLARMQALPRLVDQTMALLREGVQSGHLPPRVLMERAATNCRAGGGRAGPEPVLPAVHAFPRRLESRARC